MTTMAAVTVVVPVYNYAHFLHECLVSLIGQTYPHWEAVVVDDASTVGDAGPVVERLADPRITLIRHTSNRGLAAARNSGIRHGTGEFILPLDSDDKLAPTYLADVLRTFAGGQALNAVFPDFETFGSRAERQRFQVRSIPALLKEQWIPGPGTLFRRSLWQACGGYCEAEPLRIGNEDWDFWLAAAECGLHVAHRPEPLYFYRQHGGSMMTRLQFHDAETREFLYQRHRKLFDRYRMGGVFLSHGYLGSAKAYWRKGDRLVAVQLAMHAFRLAPVDWLQSVSGVTTRWIHRLWRGGDLSEAT